MSPYALVVVINMFMNKEVCMLFNFSNSYLMGKCNRFFCAHGRAEASTLYHKILDRPIHLYVMTNGKNRPVSQLTGQPNV